MESATFKYADVVLFFADQYQTLAVYDKTNTKTPITPIILFNGSQVFNKLRLNSGTLEIMKGISPPSAGTTWIDCLFAVPKAAADTWQEGESIIIGMGDIRGLKASLIPLDLNINDIIVTSTGQFKLHFALVAKTKKTARKKTPAGKKVSVKKPVAKGRKK